MLYYTANFSLDLCYTSGMKKTYYSYETFKNDTKTLANICKKENFDTIIALARGGMSLAQALAEALDIRDVQTIQTQLYDGSSKRKEITVIDNTHVKDNAKVLIVDDIADSGETLKEVLKHLHNNYPNSFFKTATLFYKHTSCCTPDFWVKEATQWVEFFWEVDFSL